VRARAYTPLLCLLILFYGYSFAQLNRELGKDACARCHALQRGTIDDTRHNEERSCEACHGPGDKHLSSTGEAGSMFSCRRASAEDVRARCGQCHRDPIMEEHAEGDVACTTCHSIHHYFQKRYLLKAVDPEMKPA
jgi:hypothetical protein